MKCLKGYLPIDTLMRMFSLKFTAHYFVKATPLDLCPADPTADMEEEDNGDDDDDEDDDDDDDDDDYGGR